MFGYCNFEYDLFTKIHVACCNGSLTIAIKPKGSVTFAMNATLLIYSM
jgi:hypothetical protein